MKSKSGVAVLAVVFIGMFFSLVSWLVGHAMRTPDSQALFQPQPDKESPSTTISPTNPPTQDDSTR